MTFGRRMTRPAQLIAISLLASHFLLAAPADSKPSDHKKPTVESENLVLRDNWALQSSAKVEARGEAVSSAAFVPKGWHHATVPTTVVSALVEDKTLPDPFFATNLRQF